MEVLDLIIKAGAVAGAIAALVALLKKIAKPVQEMQASLKATHESLKATHESVEAIGKRMDKIEKHDTEQYLGILRLTVMSPEMPISERLIAGQKYVALGGNGDVKHYYQELVKNHTK